MSWTNFYNFNDILEINPFAHKEGLSRDWKCSFDGEMSKFAKRDGCILNEGGEFKNDDCGIYWLRANQPCKSHPSGVWDYIGESKNRAGVIHPR